MKRTFFYCSGVLLGALLLTAVAFAAGPHSAARPSLTGRFVQDRFVIGFWVDPPADEKMNQHYQEIAAANFTMVIGGFGAQTAKQVKRQLALCQKYNLKAIVASAGSDPRQFPDGPACWGYMLRDEPSVKDFPELAKKVAALREARPGKLPYINLFPNNVSLGAIGTSSYDEYLHRFLAEVGIEVLSMDHYPLFRPDADGREGYCRDLAVLRQSALQSGRPFWNYFNSMPFGDHTDPTEAQLRWQIYTSIAYGAKGVMYFCYTTPLSEEFPKGGAIIDRRGRPTRHYEQARRINSEIRNLGPTLMQLTSSAVIRVTSDTKTLAGSPISKISGARTDPAADYLIGVFRHADGRRAVLINNYRFAYTAWPTVEFDADPSQVMEVDKATGKEHPVIDDSPDMPGLQLSLDAGEGRLFLLPPSSPAR